MAFTTILFTISIAVVVNAAFPGFPDLQFPTFDPSLMFPSPPSVSNLLDNFPNVRKFRPSAFRPGATAFAMPSMPPMPSIPTPTFPSVEEIASQVPKGGGSFNGVVVAAKSVGTRDENGNIVRNGGATALINDNGKITVHHTGESPPEIVVHKVPPFPNFPEPKLPKFSGYKFPSPIHKPFKPFKPFKPHFEPFEFTKIDPEFMKNNVPRQGENYHAVSSSSHSFSKNINGKKESGGSVSFMMNDNGKVDEDHLAFHKRDP